MTFRFNRHKSPDLGVDTLRHMVTADPLTFEKPMPKTQAQICRVVGSFRYVSKFDSGYNERKVSDSERVETASQESRG